MKTRLLFSLALLSLAVASCQRHTVIYRTKAPVVYKKSSPRASSPAPTKTIPGMPYQIGDPSPASTSTSY